MPDTITLSKTDTSLLLRIVGSRKGATFEDLANFERAHHRKPATEDQMRESITRLIGIGIIVQQGPHYVGKPNIQAAFLNEVRNCRDTIEEFSVLTRVLEQHFPHLEATRQ